MATHLDKYILRSGDFLVGNDDNDNEHDDDRWIDQSLYPVRMHAGDKLTGLEAL